MELVANRFRLLGVVGRGNMGEVHRARDEQASENESIVAIKLILRTRAGGTPDSHEVSTVQRFQREIRIMRRLYHPHLPRLVDGGVDDAGRPYLAMEFLSGETLRDLIAEYPQLPLRWVVAVGAQIADGLFAAHLADVIHRDLKPANVMLTKGGQVKVLDFGMGRIIDDTDTSLVTGTGITVGTARYMAPEQFRRSAVTPAADLYALGCVLFEMLTGVAPFMSEVAYEVGEQHLNDVPPEIRILRSDVPEALNRLVVQLLAKDPALRPVTAADVRDRLCGMLESLPESAPIPGWEDLNPVNHLPVQVTPALAPAIGNSETSSPGRARPTVGMDVFAVHEQLIADYRRFTEGGTVIRNDRIKSFVEEDLDSKAQWPEPWLSLSPSFASGGNVVELVRDGVLHPECARIFQAKKREDSAVCDGRPLALYRHQREAIDLAQSGASYVLTTGTGSGKSLSYIVPIVDRVLRTRAEEGPQAPLRVRAIVVYPMNALANSQVQELDKYLRNGYGSGNEPVTYARYTGQESEHAKKAIRDNPPDILLTNYVMLELMLTRPDERRSLIKMAHGLEFLVFDELHTYRGRQGADVALLIRRVRQACAADRLQCIGTSATMSSEGTAGMQRRVVADVATDLFGTAIAPEHVIGETLVRATGETPESVPAERLRAPGAPRAYSDLVADPLARWIETRFGLTADTLKRQPPARVADAAKELADETGVPESTCVAAIQQTLQAGAQARNPKDDRPLFAFRLHQFLSKGDTVYVTLEDEMVRHLTREYQLVQPGSGGKILLPLAFCRECGQEYLTVWRTEKDGQVVYEPRRDTSATGGRTGDGYLYIDRDRGWPSTVTDAIKDRLLPDSWLETDESGLESVRDSYLPRLPRSITVDPYGFEGCGDLDAAFIPAPFLFCPQCGVSYEQVRGKDFAKLATLDQEGRSSATSVISASVVRSLRAVAPEALDARARKLLAFVDNRQDASLQAGHFNDFVQVTQLRGALYRAALDAGPNGLQHEDLAEQVTKAMALTPTDFSHGAGLAPSLARAAERTLRDVVAFRVYLDLERGWRVTMPNLEQTGLIEIDYADLGWLAGEQERWAATSDILVTAEADQREQILRTLLDEMRRALAIDVQYFRDDFDTLQRASEERLIDPWVLSKNDGPRVSTVYPQPSRPGMDRAGHFLGGRGKFGKYLRRSHFPHLSIDDTQKVIVDLLRVLTDAGLVNEVSGTPERSGRGRRPTGGTSITGYRISAATLVWRAGKGQVGAYDPLTRTYASGDGPRVNDFFRDLYRDTARELSGLVAREHTAQVSPAEREAREIAFRAAELKLLYCSPTMELGVDISELNAVLMRNVPPTPANYAQRSGRAGRSGQPALITTYCATGNSHDQYYFRRSERMVAGVVAPPRLDLANEDLVRSHIHALWLAESGLKLGHNIPAVLDISYPEGARVPAPLLKLHDDIQASMHSSAAASRTVAAARQALAALIPEFREKTSWWDEDWIEDKVRHAPHAFDRAFDRWRDLFRAALIDQAEQNRRVLDHTLTDRDQRTAVSRRREAETQLALLKNESAENRSVLSDFNPYRYLASEGFLPGYSFPRLPLAAYVPTSGRRSDDGDYLQRPRFLAIREFGPGALIYHEGARYQVTRIQLPPDSGGEVSTTSARRCESCGYHHDTRDHAVRCEMCDEPLRDETTGLLQLHTVYTRRRERISSDEEERRRAGFRLVTSYRFTDHGLRPGRRDAQVSDSEGQIATLAYGDSATVRITNKGRLRAKPDEPDGFWLDPVNGEWMNERDAAEAAGDSSEMPIVDAAGNEQRRKRRVLPYVEDRRNILVVKLAVPQRREVALSLMYALERGIEAAFELEDSELVSELLPPVDGPRDRMLFMEAAEGGAGVLRQLQSDPDALAAAAAEALDICHFTEDGADRGGAHPDRPCARGCYECLLTYGNQLDHSAIDRQLINDLLVRFANGEALATGRGESRSEQLARLTGQADSSLETDLLSWLKARGYHLPHETQHYVPGALAKPDFAYLLPGVSVAIFVDGPMHDHAVVAERDADAEERLYDLGWEVLRFPHDGDWSAIVKKHPSYFGTGSGS
ncbi:protein kinase domain-containing protein [Micromonospora echinospora]